MGADLAIRATAVDLNVLQPGNVDTTVDDCVCDVDAFGAKLPGKGLAQGSHGKLASCKVAEPGRAPKGSRSAGDDQGRGVRRVIDRLKKQR